MIRVSAREWLFVSSDVNAIGVDTFDSDTLAVLAEAFFCAFCRGIHRCYRQGVNGC